MDMNPTVTQELAASQSQAVCVLGMHRSGTSMTTRLLNLLGVNLGPEEEFLRVAPDNPLGFWEHQAFMNTNEEILRCFGLVWDSLDDFPQGWEQSVELEDLRGRARELIQSLRSSSPLWGWKDPRTCVTLPFWQQLVGEMKYVICLRNPLDVAASLMKRNGFTLEKGIGLWLKHVQSSLFHTKGKPRLFVFYEDALVDQQTELQRLATFLDIDPAKVVQIQDAAKEFISEELRHHSTSPFDTVEHSTLIYSAKALYLALRHYVDSQRKGQLATEPSDIIQQDTLASLSSFAAAAEAERIAHMQRVVESGKRIQELQHAKAENDRQLNALHSQRAAQEGVIIELRQQLASTSASLQRVSDAREQLARQFAAQQAERENVINELNQQVAQNLQQIAALQWGNQDKEQQLSAAQAHRDQLETAVRGLQNNLDGITKSRAWKLATMLWKLR